MLVLTRKQQEKIQIGENITITVLRTKGKAVRLGIEAPDNVPVLRGELAAARQEEAVASVETTASTPTRVTSSTVRAEPTGDWKPEKPETGPSVSMHRVSRSRIATVLPTMLGPKMSDGEGPLRSMLDRRAAATQV